MRFVKLTEAELITLQEGHKNGAQFQLRDRCQCLVLSSQGMPVSHLAKFFDVSDITIYSWFDRWDRNGLVGLMNKPGQGRKPILSLQNPAHVKQVKAAIKKNPQSVKAVVAELEQVLDESLSVDTVKRFLKNLITASTASEHPPNQGRWVLNAKKKRQP
jgi:transposase